MKRRIRVKSLKYVAKNPTWAVIDEFLATDTIKVNFDMWVPTTSAPEEYTNELHCESLTIWIALSAGVADLPVALLLARAVVRTRHLLEGDLFVLLGVRQDGGRAASRRQTRRATAPWCKRRRDVCCPRTTDFLGVVQGARID